MRYRLNKKLFHIENDTVLGPDDASVEIMNLEEYKQRYPDLVPNHALTHSLQNVHYCKADLLRNCIVGTFAIPKKENLLGPRTDFGYYMDKTKLIFVDDSGTVSQWLHEIEKIQIMEKTYVVHFFFEFLEFIINKDVGFLQEFEERMTALEDSLSGETIREFDREILRCRKELLRLNSYYTQLIDIGETLSENHNHILNEDDCRLFQLYVDRVSRLYDTTKDLRESALQIFEMYQSRIDTRQNNIMQFLTVVTTIFLPLTLIAGWYGMNFANMPELGWKYGYLVIVAISAIIVILEFWYFKRKHWFK